METGLGWDEVRRMFNVAATEQREDLLALYILLRGLRLFARTAPVLSLVISANCRSFKCWPKSRWPGLEYSMVPQLSRHALPGRDFLAWREGVCRCYGHQPSRSILEKVPNRCACISSSSTSLPPVCPLDLVLTARSGTEQGR